MNLPGGTPRAVAIVVSALVLAGGAALLVVDDEDGEQQVATGATTSTTEEPTTTTTTLVVTTTVPAPVTVATVPATTATTRPPTTTTTKAPARTFTLTPTSGPGYREVKAAGGGCTGPDAGVGLTVYAPSGKGLTGSGAAAMPDGTWEVPMSVPPDEGPGRYKLVASCTNGNRPVFTYAPNYYTVTG